MIVDLQIHTTATPHHSRWEPGALARHVRPGPIDEEGWSLLVANAAVAAKLRQIKPHLEGLLREQGWQVSSIRIRVQSN